ncbi:MAG: SPOR domain-containing protein [Rhodocyclaceae bacterium]
MARRKAIRTVGRSRPGGGGSTMLGILFGLVLGILIALGVAWYVNKAPLPFQSKAGKPAAPASKPAAPATKQSEPADTADEPPRQAKAAPPAAQPAQPAQPATQATAPVTLPGRPGEKPAERPRFDFYKMLPSGEEPSAKSERPEKKPEVAPAPAPAPTEPTFLQAGSFQNPGEADNLKAKLALLGLEAGVQATELPGKGTVHRVRIGPFTKPAAMNRARALLAENGVQAKVVKVK